ETARAGFRAAWVDDSHVAYRIPSRPFAGEPMLVLNLDGAFTGPHMDAVAARQGDDTVLVANVQVSPENDRCFGPVVSKRGDVAFQCLSTGLYLHRPATASA